MVSPRRRPTSQASPGGSSSQLLCRGAKVERTEPGSSSRPPEGKTGEASELTLARPWETTLCLHSNTAPHCRGRGTRPPPRAAPACGSARPAARASAVTSRPVPGEARRLFLFSFLRRGEKGVLDSTLNPNLPIKLDLGQDHYRCVAFSLTLHLSKAGATAPRTAASLPRSSCRLQDQEALYAVAGRDAASGPLCSGGVNVTVRPLLQPALRSSSARCFLQLLERS